jgi:hypothetical protein
MGEDSDDSISDQLAQDFIDQMENENVQEQQQVDERIVPQAQLLHGTAAAAVTVTATPVPPREKESGDLQVAIDMDTRVQALMKDDGAVKKALGLDDSGVDDAEIAAMMEQMKEENRLFGAGAAGVLVVGSSSAGGHSYPY